MTANNHNIKLDVRQANSSVAAEIYISATPKETLPAAEQAELLFTAVRDALITNNACILQERVFGTVAAMKITPQIRSKIYGDIADGVSPTFLVSELGAAGPLCGVQVYAIRTDNKPQIINFNGTSCGRIVRLPGVSYLLLSAISESQHDSPKDQAKAMLEIGESILKQYGVDFRAVPRTWMWLKDVLSWYGDFNRVRNKFFTERGIIGKGSRQSMPASTGIGLGPSNGAMCAMDLTAVIEPANSIQFLHAAGKQQCALEYGSAFSRASQMITPAGKTVFISGTASIDASGATTNIGNAAAQINDTIENVRAVLRDMNCSDEDVVQVVAYCKTAEVEKIFNTVKSNLDWPWVTAICDICRDDLLFEIEAAALIAN